MRRVVGLLGAVALGLSLAALADTDDDPPAGGASSDGVASEAEAEAEPEAEPQQDSAENGNGPSRQVVYVPPSRGAARARTGAGTRGVADAPTLAVLAPDHVGVTNRAQPTFAWFLSETTAGRIDFTLVDPEAVEPLVETTLGSPFEAGVQLLPLAEHGAELAPGRRYDWAVALVNDPDNRDLDVVATGAIRYEPPSPEVEAAIEAGTPPHVALARAGVWYDAMAELSSAIEARPGDAGLREQRASLLEQVGVGAAAAYEREQGADAGT